MKEVEKTTIDLAKAGSQKAFNQLYKEYYDLVHRNVYNIVKNTDVADDITSETFVKAFMNIEKYVNNISFSMWLKTIANNNSIDFIRNSVKRKNDVYVDDSELTEIPYSDYSNPEKNLIAKEVSEKIESELNKLENRGGEALRLRLVDELSYKEIAEKLDLNIGTIKHYIFKCKKKLKTKLTNTNKQKNEKKSILFNGNKITG